MLMRMALDPDSFSSESGGAQWRFWATPRLGQFDIATTSDDAGWGPSALGLVHLERALERLDDLYDSALAAAEGAWIAHYRSPARPHQAWSLTRLLADQDGRLVLTLYEGEFDAYGAWDVTLRDDKVEAVARRGV